MLRILLVFVLATFAAAQEPLDVFSDLKPLEADHVRVPTWNLQHLAAEGGDARAFWPGEGDDEHRLLVRTFGKAILDLGLDAIVLVEWSLAGEKPADLLEVLEAWLDEKSGALWELAASSIAYDDPANPVANLQFAFAWNTERIGHDPAQAVLLEELRQPSNGSTKRLRAPWRLPIKAGDLELDLIALHLKSGGGAPQGDEVGALEEHLRAALGPSGSRRHTVVLGDWNIRPDQSQGRARLRQMCVPDGTRDLMRLLTVEVVGPALDVWERLEDVPRMDLDRLLPFTHFNKSTRETFLDHVAISRTLDEIFEHPVRVTCADGSDDIEPGLRIAMPAIPEEQYLHLTDHLPVILVLPTKGEAPAPLQPATLQIASALPDPHGSDRDLEEVELFNPTAAAIPLVGWSFVDAAGSSWPLSEDDGVVPAGGRVTVVRRRRAMSLDNDGDEIELRDPAGQVVGRLSYGPVATGQRVF